MTKGSLPGTDQVGEGSLLLLKTAASAMLLFVISVSVVAAATNRGCDPVSILIKSLIQTAVFMICARAMVQLRPKGDYEKYLKLLVSLMILSQITFALTGLWKGGGEQENSWKPWNSSFPKACQRQAA